MEVKVKLSNLRTAPRKVRQVVDLIRGKNALQAQTILSFTVNKSASPVLKLLNSAIASAKNDMHLDEANLFVSSVAVDEGPKLKRWHPMSRGRAYPIIKRSSHVMLVLSERISSDKKSVNEKTVIESKSEKTIEKPVKKVVKAKKTATAKKTTKAGAKK